MRSVFVIGPDKRVEPMLTYPMTTGGNFHEVLCGFSIPASYREAHSGDASELEARAGRHHAADGFR